MKRFYSFILSFVAAMLAVPASAQVETIADLFGSYRFTADLEIVDPSASDKFSNDCVVTIEKGDAFIDAYLCGLAGDEGSSQPIYKLTSDKDGLILRNPNGGNWDAWTHNYYMTDIEGHNPYDIRYSDIVFNFDPATLEFTLPDFSFVSITDWSAAEGTIVAKFTNVKMTLIAKEEIEIPNISGDYYFTANQIYNYGVVESWPTEFYMSVKANDETNKTYTVQIHFDELGAFVFDAKFDGQKLVLAYDNVCADQEMNVYFAPSYGVSLTGTIDFNLVGQNLSLSSGILFAIPNKDADGSLTLENIFWIGSGIAKNMNEVKPDFTYAGKYNATATANYEATPGATPTEGVIEIEYDEAWDMYVVTNFLGYDTYSLNYGGIELVIDEEDPMKGKLNLNMNNLEFLGETEGGDYKYYVLLDGNLQNTYLNVTFTEDGTLTLGDFCIGTSTWMGTEETALVTWYSGLTAVKAVPSAKDWIGEHETNAVYAYVVDGAEVPTSGKFTVSYYEATDEYLVEDFMGYDLYSMNWGGLVLTIDADDPHKAKMECGVADFDADAMVATNICDVNMGLTTIDVTLNDDGTVTLGDFSIATGNYGSNPTDLVASTSIATGIKTVAEKADNVIFNASGMQTTKMQKGINIVKKNGKYVKVLVK